MVDRRLSDSGFDFAVLSVFGARREAGAAEQRLPDALLAGAGAQGHLKRRGRQRTDSTFVPGALRVLNRLERVAQTLRAALNALAAAAPDWLPAAARRLVDGGYIRARNVDWDAEVATCPQGRRSVRGCPTQTARGPMVHIGLALADCTPCAAHPHCTRPRRNPAASRTSRRPSTKRSRRCGSVCKRRRLARSPRRRPGWQEPSPRAWAPSVRGGRATVAWPRRVNPH
jgi:hypothetical protein